MSSTILSWCGGCEDVSGEHPLHPLDFGRLIGENAARHLVHGVLFAGAGGKKRLTIVMAPS